MSDLREQAEALGIDVDGRWSDKRLQKEIDAVLNSKTDSRLSNPVESIESEEDIKASGATVRNTRANLLDLKCVEIAGNGEADLTAEQMTSPRVQRAIETGVLVEV